MYRCSGTPMKGRATLIYITLVSAAASLTGCENDAIQAYAVPKDPIPVVQAQTPEPHADLRQLIDWIVPEGWRESEKKGPFRIATFEAGSDQNLLEIVVTGFADTGGGLANVNRWRRQIGLDPISEDDLLNQVSPYQNEGIVGIIVDMTGPKPNDGEPAKRLVGAIMYDRAGIGWFVKAMDRSSIVAFHKEAIEQFARSFQSRSSPHEHEPQESPGESHGFNPPITWQQPPDWEIDTTPSQIVTAAFNIPDEEGNARMTVTALGGDGGGALANINRWRGQVSLPPVQRLEDQPATRLDVAGSLIAMIDLVGQAEQDQQGKRILVALLAQPQQTWYFKMTGPERVVAKQKPAFEQFLRSVQFQTDPPTETDGP